MWQQCITHQLRAENMTTKLNASLSICKLCPILNAWSKINVRIPATSSCNVYTAFAFSGMQVIVQFQCHVIVNVSQCVTGLTFPITSMYEIFHIRYNPIVRLSIRKISSIRCSKKWKAFLGGPDVQTAKNMFKTLCLLAQTSPHNFPSSVTDHPRP